MSPTIRTVASYDTHQEHSVDFFGKELMVIVTANPSVIMRWISNVQSHYCGPDSPHPLVLGVGVQWTPDSPHSSPPRDSSYADPPPGSYHAAPPPPRHYVEPQPHSSPPRDSSYADPPPGSYHAAPPPPRHYVEPPPDTLQLCMGQRCLIIQLSHCDSVPNELRRFLADPQTTFVGVWNHEDVGKLIRSRHQLQMGRLLDIKDFIQDSRGRSMRACSFEEIVRDWMGYGGVRLDPEISMSDWSVYNLSDEQILQASIDAHVCFEIGVHIRLWEV